MCGIAGLLDMGTARGRCNGQVLTRMLDRIAHRGPVDQGIWHEEAIWLGHRRLSIVDLSPLGHQPMASASGRFIVAFNGEIYNHAALRKALVSGGWVFRGHSDTEVLLALFERYGLVEALQHCVGMFAIALWDRQAQTLHLARDRFGEKPLYYGQVGPRIVFASDLRAVVEAEGFDHALDPQTVRDVVQRGYVQADRSIYRDIGQVPPGCVITVKSGGLDRPQVEQYHDIDDVLAQGLRHRFEGSFDDAVDEVERRLQEAVSLQLQADVPVGAFLSGGVDSSIVTALMVRNSAAPVSSYSIGFDNHRFDEAPHARAVAAHLGTRHTEFYVSEDEAQKIVPTLAGIYSEPLADASQIPTLVLSRLVRRDVTVALTGDGADEIFGGYPKYQRGHAMWALGPRRAGRAMAARAASQVAPALRALLPRYVEARVPWHRLATATTLYGARSASQLADRLGTLNREPDAYVAGPLRHAGVTASEELSPLGLSYRREAMRLDLHRYLPGDILCKVDRATMAAALESRAPMLDHRVFAFAASLPEDHLFGGGSKRVLHALLHRLVPRPLVDRPKSGFQAPLADWLRNGLKDWAHDMLEGGAASQVLDLTACRQLLAVHLQGHHDLSSRVWPLLTLAAWAREHLSGTPAMAPDTGHS